MRHDEAYDVAILAVFLLAIFIGRVCFCSVLTMDKEVQREASAAGLMVGIFILFLLTTLSRFPLLREPPAAQGRC